MSDNSAGEIEKLPAAQDVLAEIKVSDNEPGQIISEPENLFATNFQTDSIARQVEYEHLKGIKDHYKHKGKWSLFLMASIGAMIVYQSILLILVGIGFLDFKEYDWLLPALLAQNLGQVVGLAVYAVKYLFSDISGQNRK